MLQVFLIQPNKQFPLAIMRDPFRLRHIDRADLYKEPVCRYQTFDRLAEHDNDLGMRHRLTDAVCRLMKSEILCRGVTPDSVGRAPGPAP